MSFASFSLAGIFIIKLKGTFQFEREQTEQSKCLESISDLVA